MEELDRLREVLSATRAPSAQGEGLVERLSRKTGLARDRVIVGLSALKDSGEVQCKDWFQGEPVGKVRLAVNRPLAPAEQRWAAVMVEAGLDETDRGALGGIGKKLEGWQVEDMRRLLSGLGALREALPEFQGQSRYVVSARYLLGSSKLLDALPSAPLRAYGIDPGVLAGPPAYLITAGPSKPEAVVLVENPQAMERALQIDGGGPVAWVATFGYGLSRSADEYGQQLASLLERGGGWRALVRQGTPPPIEALLAHPNLLFWGDLDCEGLRIYWRLKSTLPQLKLSGLYTPMRARLERGALHHPYTELVAKANQRPWRCPEGPVQELLELCAHRAVDQEALDTEDIRRFCHCAYSSDMP